MGESVVVHLARRVDRLERKNRRPKKALLGMRRELTYLEQSRRRLNRGALAQLALLLLAMDALYRLDSLSPFRLGELLGLQWGDLDIHGRFIEVRRNLVADRITTPKSGRPRRVDMSSQLADTLRALLVTRKAETLKKGWPKVPEWVFCNEDGGPLDGDNLRHRVFYKPLGKAGLRRIRFHDLRHTFASHLLQQNESPTYVKEQMGHSSIQVTVDIYGHLIPGANRQAVDRLDDAPICNPGATGKAEGVTA